MVFISSEPQCIKRQDRSYSLISWDYNFAITYKMQHQHDINATRVLTDMIIFQIKTCPITYYKLNICRWRLCIATRFYFALIFSEQISAIAIVSKSWLLTMDDCFIRRNSKSPHSIIILELWRNLKLRSWPNIRQCTAMDFGWFL